MIATIVEIGFTIEKAYLYHAIKKVEKEGVCVSSNETSNALIQAKIQFLQTLFADSDPLYQEIERCGWLGELFSYNPEFFEKVEYEGRYTNGEAGSLLKLNGQRILNLMNDERGFINYIDPLLIGNGETKKYYRHKIDNLFKLYMHFFLLSKGRKGNEIAELLGYLTATSKVMSVEEPTSDSIVQKEVPGGKLDKSMVQKMIFEANAPVHATMIKLAQAMEHISNRNKVITHKLLESKQEVITQQFESLQERLNIQEKLIEQSELQLKEKEDVVINHLKRTSYLENLKNEWKIVQRELELSQKEIEREHQQREQELIKAKAQLAANVKQEQPKGWLSRLFGGGAKSIEPENEIPEEDVSSTVSESPVNEKLEKLTALTNRLLSEEEIETELKDIATDLDIKNNEIIKLKKDIVQLKTEKDEIWKAFNATPKDITLELNQLMQDNDQTNEMISSIMNEVMFTNNNLTNTSFDYINESEQLSSRKQWKFEKRDGAQHGHVLEIHEDD